MSRPLNEPASHPRAVLYGRVSAVMGRGDELTSPELQERVVRSYCERLGYEPLLWLCDVDRTGTEWSRRQVEEAVRMIEGMKPTSLWCRGGPRSRAMSGITSCGRRTSKPLAAST